jgi:hypothetical protein
MTNVIDFQAVLNARRVAVEVDRRAELDRQRVVNKTVDVASDLALEFGLDIPEAAFVAKALVEKAEALKAAKYQPAYCDPANEFRGSKFEATRSLDVKEIAKRMRADIKALGLGAGFKCAVRIDRFSGGQSIDIRVTVPDDFKFWAEPRVSWFKQFGDNGRFPGPMEDQYSPEFIAMKERLDAVHNSYNRDNSDSSSDYFCVRYYGSVNFDGMWQGLKDQAAAYEGQYWADDAF